VLITRSSGQSDGFAELVRRRGGNPLIFPAIEIVGSPSREASDRAIAALYMYDGLIFTSVNGVEFFMKRLKEAGENPGALRSKLMYVVGEKTAQALKNQGLTPTLMPEKFSASELAKLIDHRDLTGKTFLFPRGNLGTDILQDTLRLMGANIDAVVVYETRKPGDEQLRELRAALLDGMVDVLTFTSPSTFHFFAEAFSKDELKRLLDRALVAVIGPVTAKAIEEAGFEADCVSPASTIESLVEAICLKLAGGSSDDAVHSTTGKGRR
jgi:uroporphyrinogen III methyltransferase/synthase